MGVARGRLGTVALVLLAVTAAVPVATVGATGSAEAAGAPTLAFDHELERLPDRPGHVRVTVTADVPATVQSLSVDVPERAAVLETEGFGDVNDRTLRWERADAEGTTPTVTYVVPVDSTDGDRLAATSTGEWALFNWRTVDVEWGYSTADGAADPTVVERAAAGGEGVVGPAYAYLGPYETLTRTVDGETVRVVVPEAANTTESPTELADALADASGELEVGARNDRLNVFVAPEPIEVTGRLARHEVDGEQDVLVGADEPLDTPDNAWFHEYVHSRQAYETGEGMDWFDDASAEYYAALLAYQGGHVSEAAFYDYVRTNETGEAVLAEAEGGADAAYFKGMRVLAALDAEVREASGRGRLESVFRAMNAHDGTVDRTAFAGLVADAAGESREAWLDRYVTTSASPEVPAYLDGVPTDTPTDDAVEKVTGAHPLGAVLFVAALLLGLLSYRS